MHENTGLSPVEGLMRGHGVIDRVLLIYTEIIGKIRSRGCRNLAVLHHAASEAAGLAKVFIEDYHQELENEYIFPLFRDVDGYEPVVNTLLFQHCAAKKITADILRLLERGSRRNVIWPRLLCLMQGYVRMYRPHSAREDTFVLPEIHKLITPDKWNELGDMFEEILQERFAKENINGFQVITDKLTETEKALGIYNLGQFTPKSFMQGN